MRKRNRMQGLVAYARCTPGASAPHAEGIHAVCQLPVPAPPPCKLTISLQGTGPVMVGPCGHTVGWGPGICLKHQIPVPAPQPMPSQTGHLAV